MLAGWFFSKWQRKIRTIISNTFDVIKIILSRLLNDKIGDPPNARSGARSRNFFLTLSVKQLNMTQCDRIFFCSTYLANVKH